jgi:hypothetical protein
MLMIALALLAADPTAAWGDRAGIIRGAEKVDAQRLTGGFDSDPHSKKRGIARWETQGAVVTLSAPLAERAKGLIGAASSYTEHGTKCDVEPGVLFRFWRGDDHADVLFCFHCGDASVAKPESEWPNEVWGFAAPSDYERSRPGFMPGFDKILKLARDIFPKDVALRNVRKPQVGGAFAE